MSTRLKQAALGFASDLGGSMLLLVMNFAAVPIILRLTSDALYGFWLAAISVLGYLGLVDLGFGLALTRAVAGQAEVTSERTNRVFSTAFYIFCVAGMIFCAAGLALAPFIPQWFHIPPENSSLVVSSYRIAIVAGALSLPISVFPAVLAGMHKMAVMNNIKNSAALLSLFFSIALLYFGLSVLALAIANMFNVLLMGALSYYHVRKYNPNLQLSPSLFNVDDLRRLWHFGGYFQGGKIASIIAGNTDPLVIAFFLGAAAVTPYSLTSKLAIFFSISLASKLPIALFPALSQMFALKETAKIRQTLILLTYYATRMAVVGAAFLVVANEMFISLWVGKASFGGMALNLVFVYWVLQDTIIRGSGVVIQASGDLRKWAAVSVAEAAVNIVSSLILVQYLGLMGVALGTSIARTPSGLYILHYTCKKIDLGWKDFLYSGMLAPFIKSLPAAAGGAAVWFLMPDQWGWLKLAIYGTLLVAGNIITFEGFKRLINPKELFKLSSLVAP